MRTYNAELFTKLIEIWPESINYTKVINCYDYRPGPFGVEKVFTGTEVENLGECILTTAQAISRGGTDIARALEYIESFSPERVKKQEYRNFVRA